MTVVVALELEVNQYIVAWASVLASVGNDVKDAVVWVFTGRHNTLCPQTAISEVQYKIAPLVGHTSK